MIPPQWPNIGAPVQAPVAAPVVNVFQWATVTQASPLRIQIDGQSAELAITPGTLVSGLAVDDRVWTQTYGRQIIVLGRAGG